MMVQFTANTTICLNYIVYLYKFVSQERTGANLEKFQHGDIQGEKEVEFGNFYFLEREKWHTKIFLVMYLVECWSSEFKSIDFITVMHCNAFSMMAIVKYVVTPQTFF